MRKGDLVRWVNEQDGGPVHRVTRAFHDGIIELHDLDGFFADHLFVLADDVGDIPPKRRALQCPGVGRDKDCISALQFYFSRPVTDDEMRFLHEVVQRAAVCMPATLAARIAKADFVEKVTPGFMAFDEQTCPGHVASKNDPKVCGRCGTHIDSLRPPECEL